MNGLCKPSDEIDRVISAGHINIDMQSAYFDAYDVEQPVKQYLSTSGRFHMASSLVTEYKVTLQADESHVVNNIFYQSDPEVNHFYSIGDTSTASYDEVFFGTFSVLGSIGFTLDQKSQQYERIAYNFLDMSGFIGGLFDFLYFLGFLIVAYYRDHKYYFSLLSNLYYVKTDQT